MISTLLATALLSSAPQTAAQRISEMIGKLHAAKTAAGTIQFTQAAAGIQVRIETKLQVDREKRRLYVMQQGRVQGRESSSRIVADGLEFTYPPPTVSNKEGEEVRESQSVGARNFSERDVFAAASPRLLHENFPLDLVVGHSRHLSLRRAQLATFLIAREDTIGDQKVIVIAGKHRDFLDSAPSGLYELWLTEDSSLLRYVRQEDVAAGLETLTHLQKMQIGAKTETIRVLSTWDVNVKLDGPLDETLFKL